MFQKCRHVRNPDQLVEKTNMVTIILTTGTYQQFSCKKCNKIVAGKYNN